MLLEIIKLALCIFLAFFVVKTLNHFRLLYHDKQVRNYIIKINNLQRRLSLIKRINQQK